MSDIVGGKAISLVQRGGIVEDEYARVFYAQGSGGSRYTVVVTSRSATCTCEAGRNGRRCYHAAAAHLFMAKQVRS
jgi:uncharacterized Zn finger protein